jgi:peptidoglycan hydrolase CwlO-like protein
MTLATIIAILGAVSTLMSIAKALPAVVDEAKSLLAKLEPYIDTANDDVRMQFESLKMRVEAA